MNNFLLLIISILNISIFSSCRTLVCAISVTETGKSCKHLRIVDANNQPLANVRCGYDAPFAAKSNRNGYIWVTQRDLVAGKLIFVLDGYVFSSYEYSQLPECIIMKKM